METLIAIAFGVAVGLLVLIIFTLIFRWIWNRTVPAVFGLKQITFWQAIGILLLASILFGGHRVVNTDLGTLQKKVEVPRTLM